MFKKIKEFSPKYEMIIDYNGIVSTANEIKDVLIEYCNKEKKNLVILRTNNMNSVSLVNC